jgi:REP element-mobilizing transposase RayT
MQRFYQTVYLSNNSNSFRGISELEKNRGAYTIEETKKILKNNKISIKPLVKIYALCLMSNHFHFLIKEVQKNGAVKFMQKLSNSYAKYFSNKYSHSGNLFAGRFKAGRLENKEQMKYLIAYINAVNPAQTLEPYLKIKGVENFSKVCEVVESYPWSSHQEFMGKRISAVIDKGLMKNIFTSSKVYDNFCREILLGKNNKIWELIADVSFD